MMKKIKIISIFGFAVLSLAYCTFTNLDSNLPQKKGIHYYWRPLSVNGGGYTNFVIIDPKSPGVVYAGVNVGGIYKSYDYGEHWVAANKGLNWPADRIVAALIIDSKNGRLYLGAGGFGKGGIFRSTDKGASWHLLTRYVRFNGMGVEQSRGKGLIIIDPSDSDTLYAGSHKDGIFKSTDAGKTWSNKGLKGVHISSMVINPHDPYIIYVAATRRGYKGENRNGGVYKSIDGGNTWEKIGGEILEVYQLEMDMQNPEIVYAACGSQGIFKTTNGGNTWTEKNKGLKGLWLSKLNLFNIRYISLALDLKNPEVIYTGSGISKGQIYKTEDGGNHWVNLTDNKRNIYPDGWWIQRRNWPGGSGYSANSLSIDQENSKRIYVSGRSGLWRSQDGGKTWHAKVQGLEATVMNRVVFHPKQKGIFYMGNTDWVFFYSINGGKTILQTLDGMGSWDTKKNRKIYNKYRMKNGRDFAIDPRTSPGTIYLAGDASVGNSGAVFKSVDGGKNWREANHGLPVAKVTAIAIDPNNYDTLFAALRSKGVYKTRDGGKNWTAVNVGLPNPGKLFEKYGNKILINHFFPDVIYILDKGNGIYKTVNGGKTWKVIGKDLPKAGFNGTIHYSGSLTMDPKNSDTLYVGLYKHGVYKTIDGGESWRKISPPYIRHGGAMDIDHQDGNLYVASVPEGGEEDITNFSFGIYKSRDGGVSWQAIHNDELLKISLRIKDLTVDPHYKGRIYLSTMGNSVIVGEPARDTL